MPLQFHINQAEMLVLTYMHEHAKGFGANFRMDPKRIAGALSFSPEEFRRHVTYLSEHRLVGLNTIDTTGHVDGIEGSFQVLTLYLTGFGEDYMRALEAEPSVARRVTVGVVKELWDVGTTALKDIAAKTLAEMLKP